MEIQKENISRINPGKPIKINNMFPTIIVDDFFTNVDEIISLSKKLKFEPPLSIENWGGLRTKSLHHNHYNLFNNIIVKILSNYFPNKEVKFSDSSVYFHKLKGGDKPKTHFHYDENFDISAVIYLSPGDINTGTTIFNKKREKQIIVGNEFNTLISYDSCKYHGPSTLNLKKERLTLNCFIKNIEVI